MLRLLPKGPRTEDQRERHAGIVTAPAPGRRLIRGRRNDVRLRVPRTRSWQLPQVLRRSTARATSAPGKVPATIRKGVAYHAECAVQILDAGGKRKEDSVKEAEATGTERPQLGGSTPSHLLGVVSGDRLIPLPHFRRPPVADVGEESGQSRVHRWILAHDEPRLVPARLHLHTLVRAPPRLGQSLPEPLRTRSIDAATVPAGSCRVGRPS